MDPTRSTESLTEAEFNFFSNPSHEQPANLAPNGISFSNLFAEAMGSNPQIMVYFVYSFELCLQLGKDYRVRTNQNTVFGIHFYVVDLM